MLNGWSKLIASVGFPIAAAVYLLWQIGPRLEGVSAELAKNTAAVAQLTEVVRELGRRVR